MTEYERSARADENYRRMRKQLDDALKKDSRLAKIAEKIKAGKANFTDTAEYSDLVAKHLSGVIQNNIGTIKSSAGIRMVCDALLKDHYEAINDVLGEVQTILDEANGIHLRPQAAAYPTERVHSLTSSLTDPTVAAQTILRRAGAPVENVAKSMHDDYMEENAKFRSDAGLKCWIVRTTDGKCCSWCTSIAGRYEYGKEPQSVYRRHDNCGCTVTYENGRQRQDVWSKRTWESDQPTPARVEPTRLTGAQGRETEQRNLSQITRFSHAQGEAVQGRNLRYRGLTSGGGSGIIRLRSSGTGNGISGHYSEIIGSVDYENRKAVEQLLDDFEAKYKGSNIEHCCVITTTGDVYEVHGDRYTVDTSILGDKLKGSINEHNHVTGESQYSFSWEDLNSCVQDGSKIALAFDEKYRYTMIFPEKPIDADILYEAYRKAADEVDEINFNSFSAGKGKIIPDEDYQHEVIYRTCEKVGVQYGRRSKT